MNDSPCTDTRDATADRRPSAAGADRAPASRPVGGTTGKARPSLMARARNVTWLGHPARRPLWLTLLTVLALGACSGARTTGADRAADARPTLASVGFNLDHLDFLGEDVVADGDTVRLIHIYAEPGPEGWVFVGDDDEGIACVDDVARAAVVYLRHYETTGDDASRRTAVKLLRFVRHLQAESGLFYNFVWDRDLRINTEHLNSIADGVNWWTARAVWALGEGARVLAVSDPAEAAAAQAAVRRVEPHLDRLLARYGEMADERGRPFPQWVLRSQNGEPAPDATSELLLGLTALQRAAPTDAGTRRVRQLADGIARTRFGGLDAFPYGGHASWIGGWHGWGNSQTQALAGAHDLAPAALASARAEADTFYPRLLVDGWLHNLDYATQEAQRFEQIAYDVRPAAVGLVRLHDATGEDRYAVLAGLAAAWFSGSNPAGAVMADPATGRGYDGILGPDRINPNAGAESTIEAQLTLLEVGRNALAAAWADARAGDAETRTWNGRAVRTRTFTQPTGERAVVVLDPSADRTHVLWGDAADRLLASPAP